MPINILILNSSIKKNQSLFDIFEELKNRKFSFLPAQLYLGPRLENKFNQILFIVFLPILCLAYLAYLAYFKFKKIHAVICVNINEKIIITPIAKLLNIKIIWIEDADSIIFKNKIIKPLSSAYKLYSNKINIVSFNNFFINNNLKKLHFKEKNINIIQPGIKLKKHEHQNNLFNELAHAGGKNYKHKFFTIGVVVNLNKKQQIEALFQSIKTCQTIISNMQFIIIGGGKERKNLSWLNKKMGLDDITWFVGEQINIKKWLDSFDIFIATYDAPILADINIILRAMSAKLPIIGFQNLGLEKIISNEECLIEEVNNEMMARQIIKLWRDKNLRDKIGQVNKERVEKYFTFNRMVGEFEKIIA